MNIINLNSSIELSSYHVEFVNAVIECSDRIDERDFNSFSRLINRIPICLINLETMDKYTKCKKPENFDLKDDLKVKPDSKVNEEQIFPFDIESDLDNKNKWTDITVCTELLGFYQSKGSILDTEVPLIGLCIERIVKCVKSNEELTYLIAKVLIHELAHAKMDMHPNAEYKSIDEFYKWMEEPVSKLSTPITL